MLYHGDAKSLPIADNSIDLIFTDLPYLKGYLPCYQWLANEAARVLKPGGFVLAMCGGMYLNQIYRFFDDSGLDYFWEFHHIHNGDAPYIWQRGVIAKSKSILAYSKGPAMPRCGGVQSRFDSIGKMKLYHHWGQDVGSARYYIDYFSSKNGIVLDPFIGGGTSAIASELIGRKWIGADLDAQSLVITNERLSNKETGAVINLPLFESATIGIEE